MTPTEDDLRAALRLLEQRTPGELPDTRPQRVRGVTRVRWLQLASVAAVVLVAAGVTAAVGLHGGAHPSAASGDSGAPSGSSTSAIGTSTAVLRVAVVVSGGPMKPNGHMALNNKPSVGARVTVSQTTSSRGEYSSQLRVTSRTDAHGIATFVLPAGRYAYRSDTCGIGYGTHRAVALRAGQQPVRVTIRCAIP